jgi:hypothetical protein
MRNRILERIVSIAPSFTLLARASRALGQMAPGVSEDASHPMVHPIWAGGILSGPQGPIGPWNTTWPFLTTIVSSVTNQIYLVGGTYINLGSGCRILGPYLHADEDGATHDESRIRAQSSPSLPATKRMRC